MPEIFIAKVLGLYLIVMGAVVITKKRAVMPAVMDIAKNRALTLVLGALELIAGLAIVVAYQEVSVSPVGLISLIGYMMVVEGIVYLALPARRMQKLIRSFGNKQWYMAGAVISVLAGVYLAGFGFGFF